MPTFSKDQLSVTAIYGTKGEHRHEVISGGDSRNPSWATYILDYDPLFRPQLELLKEAVINWGWVGKTGEEICNDYVFVFSTGERIGFTWRAWGDFMQAVVDKQEGYMMYYMQR
jgi:hypothetical protein